MIEHDELCQLIPHSGKMCLLDRVIRWDEASIECESSSHLLPDNPLRHSECLTTINLVEYGTQAMAVHGGLIAREKGHRLGNGYLAALRDVKINDQDVSLLPGELRIEAARLMAEGGNLIYQFRVTLGELCIVQGRATVFEVTK